MDRRNIEKIARTPEDKVLLAKVWDKINAGMRRNITASTCFLSPREMEMTKYLFGDVPGLMSFGGYKEAERQMLVFLPEYLDEEYLYEEGSPIVCLRATYFDGDSPSHRDFLGALIGTGIAREAIGDLCIGKGSCDFFVTAQIAPYITENFTSAGGTHLHLSPIRLDMAQIPEPEMKPIKDTLASLRLDSVISAGFRIGRNYAVDCINAGRCSVNGLPCQKPDKAVCEGDKISVRGMGKIRLSHVNGQTKKGRISVVIHRYV